MSVARVKIPYIITIVDDDTGALEPVEAALVSIVNRTSAATQLVYPTESALTPSTQPISTDSEGRIPGYIARSNTTLTITIPGRSPYTIDWDAAPGADGSIASSWLADDVITNAKLADSAVGNSKVQSGSLNLNRLADASGSAQIIVTDSGGTPTYQSTSGDVTVSTGGALTIGATKITTAKIADSAVGSTQIANAAITTAKLDASSVTTIKLNDESVTNAKLGPLSVDAFKLAQPAVFTAQLATGAVTTAKIATDAVTSAKLGAIRFGTDVITLGGTTTVTHDLGGIPSAVLVSGNDPVNATLVTNDESDWTGTQFTVRAYNNGGGGGVIGFSWLVIR